MKQRMLHLVAVLVLALTLAVPGATLGRTIGVLPTDGCPPAPVCPK